MITYSMGLWLWLVASEVIVRQSWHVKLDDYQVGYKTLCSSLNSENRFIGSYDVFKVSNIKKSL